MAVSLKKKPVTVYLQELKYLIFQQMAAEQNRKAAELVRDAMDEYIQNHKQTKKTLSEWQSVSLGGLKDKSKDWISKDYQDEMLGREF
jgi:protein-disulfide isomerase